MSVEVSGFKISVKAILIAVAMLIVVILGFSMSGINDAGQRTVIQYPTGTLTVKFSPGLYWTWFGKEVVYNDVITFDFDKLEAEGESSLDQTGIAVRYQDGGTGTIFGKARYSLPADEPTMIELHKAFRSNDGVAYKLIKSVTEESMNLTAGLMTSEEAYAEKRGTFTEWSRAQLEKGKFYTRLESIVAEEETGKKVTKNIPVIDFGDDGRPKHYGSDFEEYGITVSGYQITDWDFEPRTLAQIATKREATMAIITAKAQAEQAKQEAITAEEKGKANVMTAKYEKEVDKQKAVVEAEQKKEVAVIEAEQKVSVAEQEKLEAEQKKLAAVEYKEEQTLRGEGDAAYKQKVMVADGALEQKLAAYVKVSEMYASAISSYKGNWVPTINQGGGQTGTGNGAMGLIELLSAKAAKDLALDMSLPAQAAAQ
jgi:hypothetical protein